MVSFENDYNRGACAEVLKAITDTNLIPMSGYGTDPYTKSAADKIRAACGREDLDVFLLVGGTQTNSIMVSALLKEYEGVVACESGHVAVHEAGAIECTGHKVLTIPQHNGKMDGGELREYLSRFYADANHEHMVFPGMVYISQPTEFGTIYSKDELKTISDVCHAFRIPLYIDGARLGYALAADDSLSLQDIAELADAFYIGGTKVGALFGEAVVMKKSITPAHFVTIVKRHGALLAKGALLGVQFDALFTNDTYLRISKHAIQQAECMKRIIADQGLTFFMESPTNQQFIVMENAKMDALQQKIAFSFWEQYDETHTVIRFVTSWATTDEDLEALKEALSLQH